MTYEKFMDWLTFCRQADDSQLLAIIKKESSNMHEHHAQIAYTVAVMRGLEARF